MSKTRELVFVGLSGGVDSSVATKRLIDAGYDVVGVFIKTWQPDFLFCNWEAERLDAMRVAAHLGIPFYTCDAEETYKRDVAEYMISEYTKGRTPNPDVMCNKFVKFGAFLDYAKARGAIKVATGHYARIVEENGTFHLYRGVDTNKDQSYFLWTLTQTQLSRILLPIGNTEKPNVRTEATHAHLPTSTKHDSQGICFLGQVDIQDFLTHYVHTEKGIVLDEQGVNIGTHEGALLYTLGQRHGFSITTTHTESTPHYVVAKDMSQNTITVSTTPKHITSNQCVLTDINYIEPCTVGMVCEAQFRYRQKPFPIKILHQEEHTLTIEILAQNIEIPSLGQSCVLYSGDRCLGGGIINDII